MSSKVLNLALPSKNNIDTYFIANDWHSFYCHEPSVKILIAMAKEISKSKRKLIINGDFLDFSPLMMSSLGKFKPETIKGRIDTFYMPKTQLEYDWANTMLDRLQKVFREIVFIEGNHDWRAQYFAETYAPDEYKKYFDNRLMLDLDKRSIPTVPYNNWVDIGHLSITHGMYHGTTAIKKHYEASGGRNVVFGHVHQAESKSFIRRENTAMGWSLPCMSTLNPDYIKNRENNWSNGFGVVNMRSNGLFNLNTVMVWEDQYVDTRGKVYSG